MAAIFVYIRKGQGVEMPGQARELQTCSKHIARHCALSPYIGESHCNSVLTGATLDALTRVNASRNMGAARSGR